ncbi:unnamed protein product [Adineta ricciae]|uniref:Uncharacterized protein n=2 Tax=Adineta ricciae TaxID=249248 RepID=A0A814K5J1_ADIRI|nr:unnamed protein product [Adineta ricciae]
MRNFLQILLILQINSVCSVCKMPTGWFGLWYQHGMNSLLEIADDRIETKGLCVDVLPSHQYYIFLDRLNRCTRCLVFIQRHMNLLQYRESECNDPDDLLNITLCPNLIAPDAALYTLHRKNSTPQLCPIQPPFQLLSLIKDGSVCHQSISSSYLNECANPYKLQLHLSPCSVYQSILDFQFMCVGTWIEDFHTYFVARILSNKPHHNQYACFSFLTKQKSSPSLSLHMATDDSCHDLYSRHISTVITFSAKNHSINDECSFPKQFQSHQWFSIDRTIRMIIKTHNIEFLGTDHRFHCQRMIHSEKSFAIYSIRSFTNCHTKQECLRITRRTDNVLELHTIPLSHERNCDAFHEKNFNFAHTFFTQSMPMSNPCPKSIGYLVYHASMDDHDRRRSLHMSIGCDDKDKLTISKESRDLGEKSIIQIDTCLASWQSDDSLLTHLIVQSSFSNASYCLTFQMTNPVSIQNNSNECSSRQTKASSIYAAHLTNPCSQSSTIVYSFLLSIMTIILYLENII